MKLAAFILSVTCAWAATNTPVAPVPVPKSPYLPRIYSYVDGLLQDPKQTTSLHEHQNLLRLLYTLSELSTKPKYREAADASLRTWLENIPQQGQPITRPWLLWNRCFEIAPEASIRYALAISHHQTTNHPGFYLRAFAAAYAHTTNEAFLRAIEDLVKPFERSNTAPPLSFAIDCDGCVRLSPEPLASRLQALAERDDDGAAKRANPEIAMMCVSRYQNTGKIAYRDAIHAIANSQLDASPANDLSPLALGRAISLQLAAWRSNAGQAHLEKARALADLALSKFYAGTPALFAGGDTLALALVELHLHILHITAVRCPPNTIDR